MKKISKMNDSQIKLFVGTKLFKAMADITSIAESHDDVCYLEYVANHILATGIISHQGLNAYINMSDDAIEVNSSSIDGEVVYENELFSIIYQSNDSYIVSPHDYDKCYVASDMVEALDAGMKLEKALV